MTEKLDKAHARNDDNACLYCDRFSTAATFPAPHATRIGEAGAEPSTCAGWIHCEFQSVGGGAIKVIFGCDGCNLVEVDDFFAWTDHRKPFEQITTDELTGNLFGYLHIINSEASLLVNFTDDVNLRPKNRGMKIQIFRALAHATLRALCRLLESPPRDWPCCDKPKTEFISGGRAPEAHHHVSVCDSCGKFNVVGDVNGQHFSVTFSLWHPNALIAAGRPIERIRNDEPASPIADLTVKATKAIRQAAEDVSNVILTVENRCLAADGPVTPTLQEMTEKELRKLWRAAQRIVTETPKRIHS